MCHNPSSVCPQTQGWLWLALDVVFNDSDDNDTNKSSRDHGGNAGCPSCWYWCSNYQQRATSSPDRLSMPSPLPHKIQLRKESTIDKWERRTIVGGGSFYLLKPCMSTWMNQMDTSLMFSIICSKCCMTYSRRMCMTSQLKYGDKNSTNMLQIASTNLFQISINSSSWKHCVFLQLLQERTTLWAHTQIWAKKFINPC